MVNFVVTICFTIGAITWFKDLPLLFEKISKCLKAYGLLFINDFHPFMNMLPLPGEDGFDEVDSNKISYSYFRKEPWIENNGMGYMTTQYASKTFTSFSHTLSDIINSVVIAGMAIKKLNEYDYDIGLTNAYDNRGYLLFLFYLLKNVDGGSAIMNAVKSCNFVIIISCILCFILTGCSSSSFTYTDSNDIDGLIGIIQKEIKTMDTCNTAIGITAKKGEIIKITYDSKVKEGTLSIQLTGPGDTNMQFENNKNGTKTITIDSDGDYTLSVEYDKFTGYFKIYASEDES